MGQRYQWYGDTFLFQRTQIAEMRCVELRESCHLLSFYAKAVYVASQPQARLLSVKWDGASWPQCVSSALGLAAIICATNALYLEQTILWCTGVGRCSAKICCKLETTLPPRPPEPSSRLSPRTEKTLEMVPSHNWTIFRKLLFGNRISCQSDRIISKPNAVSL